MNAMAPPVGMDAREQAVHELFFRQGLTTREVADELATSRNAVAGLVSRMRLKWPVLDAERPKASPIKAGAETGAEARPRVRAFARKAATRRPRAATVNTWSEAEVATLTERYPRGGVAACAPHLPGRSRDAIMQKAHALGLAVVDRRRLLSREEAYAEGVASAPVSASSRFETCQWPIGDPGEDDFHFCGDPTARQPAPYCPKHCAAAYRVNGSEAA